MAQLTQGSGASFYSFGNASTFTNVPVPEVAKSLYLSALQQPYAAVGITLVLAVLLGSVLGFGKKKLPPGVKPLPMHSGLPPEPGIEAAWYFGALHKKYGPIYAWKIMGITHIWIETDEVSRDLFVKRQRKYCDRNPLPASIGIREGKEVLPLMAYSETWKRYKNFMHFIMKDASPKAFYGWPAIENKRTLRRLLEAPERWSEHMIVHCSRTIGSIAWGDPEHGNKLLTIVPELLKAVSPAGPLINKLTFLMHLPAFISPWKRSEARRKQEMTEAFYEALDDVKEKMKTGDVKPCWSTLWLAENEKGSEAKKLDYHEAAHAIGSSSFVAIATIGGPLHAFFLAMCHYPEWLPKMQEEIDRVCGDRLPAQEDIPNMPRLRATTKEMLRWRQSTPLGVPHVTLEDDVYNGYYIPKGAICHANNYLISREPKQFPKADQFIPERWLDPAYPTYKEPLTEFPNLRGDIAFGYGNRGCPGTDLTSLELFTLFGALAAVFDIKKPEGTEHLPWYEVHPYVITMTLPFPVDIKPRSEKKRQWILDNCQDAGWTLKTKDQVTSRWDVLDKEKDGSPFSWQGVCVPYVQPKVPRVYPEGV